MSARFHSDHPDGLAPELSFVLMDGLMDEFAEKTQASQAGRLERFAMFTGVAGAVAGILLGWLLPKPFDLYAALTGLAVELLGLGIGTFLSLKRDWRSLRHARRGMAESMDADFQKYEQYVHQLRRFPARARARRHRYIRDRSSRMMSRTRFFTGGMERLGVVPLLLALYVQLKDWRFGDWAALASVTMIQGILIFALLLSYLLFLHLLRIHTRIEAIEALLNEAAERDREEACALPAPSLHATAPSAAEPA